jgi:hypothetical protein
MIKRVFTIAFSRLNHGAGVDGPSAPDFLRTDIPEIKLKLCGKLL